MYILYKPNVLRKFFQYIVLLMVGILIILSMIGLFYLIKLDTATLGLKLVFLYLLFTTIILLLIGFYIGHRKLVRLKYTISIDEVNSITYQMSKNIVKQFTFSDITSITEDGVFCFNLKEKSTFYLPYQMENYSIFFEKLFNNYKIEISDEELFKPLKRKKSRYIAITFIILMLPFMLIPLLLGNLFVIFLSLLLFTPVFLLIDDTELKKINPDTIEIQKNFKTIVILKDDVNEIKFERRFIHLPRGGGTYQYNCELITKSNKIYTFKNSSLSIIDLYCYLTFWTNTIHQRCLAQ